jgi:hypothetical protein
MKYIKLAISYWICKVFHKKHHKEKEILLSFPPVLEMKQTIVHCTKCDYVIKDLGIEQKEMEFTEEDIDNLFDREEVPKTENYNPGEFN